MCSIAKDLEIGAISEKSSETSLEVIDVFDGKSGRFTVLRANFSLREEKNIARILSFSQNIIRQISHWLN